MVTDTFQVGFCCDWRPVSVSRDTSPNTCNSSYRSRRFRHALGLRSAAETFHRPPRLCFQPCCLTQAVRCWEICPFTCSGRIPSMGRSCVQQECRRDGSSNKSVFAVMRSRREEARCRRCCAQVWIPLQATEP